MAAAPQITEPDLCDSVHVIRGLVDGAGLVEVSTTGVKIADGESVPALLFKAVISASQ
jgi:hypothetical protein